MSDRPALQCAQLHIYMYIVCYHSCCHGNSISAVVVRSGAVSLEDHEMTCSVYTIVEE